MCYNGDRQGPAPDDRRAGLALLMFAIAAVLAVLVTYRFVRGYMRSGARPIRLLALGMFLLAPAPLFLRLIKGNVLSVPPAVRILVVQVRRVVTLEIDGHRTSGYYVTYPNSPSRRIISSLNILCYMIVTNGSHALPIGNRSVSGKPARVSDD